MTTNEIMELVLSADPNAYRYFSEETTVDYTAWHEFARDPFWGDNDAAEDGWRFQVDRFTRTEDDPMVETIWNALKGEDRVTVQHTVRFEKDTGYIHHVFTCRGR